MGKSCAFTPCDDPDVVCGMVGGCVTQRFGRQPGAGDRVLHRWNCEAVEAKGKAAKGSKAKKTDDLESYVYRDDDGHIAIPGEYLRQAVIHAAKFRQDPRSPRKSKRG